MIVDLFPIYTSTDDLSAQVYLYSLLNGKESHCKSVNSMEYFVGLRDCVVLCSPAL